MELSVVTTLYKSEIFLDSFIEKITNTIIELNINNYELIFVNDGSPDNSLLYLIELQKSNKFIKIIDLSRNFGHHYAIQAGLTIANGDFIFLIDNDLETPPNFLKDCFELIKKDNSIDVVYGYQMNRKGKLIEKSGGSIFWKILNSVSDVEIPHNLLTERLMTRQFVRELLRLQDANLFMAGMWHWTGFKQIGIPVAKGLREGASTYTLKKRIKLMLEAITSFSGRPLEWLFYAGITISFFSFLFLIFLAVKKLIYQDDVQLGWTSIITLNILILGILSTFLGLIGIYIYKIFKQVQGRPNFIIKKIYEK